MTDPLSVVFVCWGNICRSPMGEFVARAWAAREGIDGVRFTSAGVSSEEQGNPIDRRAASVLAAHGYPSGGHRAHRISAAEVADADLVLGFEPLHVARLHGLAPRADNIRLVTDFDPDAAPGSGIDDPWYGNRTDFEETLASVEAAMPALMDWLRTHSPQPTAGADRG